MNGICKGTKEISKLNVIPQWYKIEVVVKHILSWISAAL